MNESNQTTGNTTDRCEPLTFKQRQILESALAKVVLLGEQVGVSIDQMILLLGSGLTVGELIEYLAERHGERC